jgi:hypothetical protein
MHPYNTLKALQYSSCLLMVVRKTYICYIYGIAIFTCLLLIICRGTEILSTKV